MFKQKDRFAKNARKGFTIIEIVVVIMIMGIIAASAIGGLRYLQRVRLQQTQQKLTALDAMIEQYYTTVGEYPVDLQELIEGPSKPQLQRRWAEPIATENELKDSWNQPFVYTLNPKGTRPPYDVESIGSKGDAHIRSPRSQES